MEIQFRVIRTGENSFGFYPKSDEGVYTLHKLLCDNFPEFENNSKCTAGLMSGIHVRNHEELKFWSENVSNYVHEVPDEKTDEETPPEFFKVVFDENQKAIISPFARI